MLKRYGDKALEQSRTRVDELAATAITTVPIPGAGLQLPLSSSPTPHRPDQCTDRNAPETVGRVVRLYS
jgi:hypothetical protein